MSDAYRTQIEIEIEAEPEQVFDYFVKPELLVRWMGDHAKLEARNGGISVLPGEDTGSGAPLCLGPAADSSPQLCGSPAAAARQRQIY